LKNPIAIFEKSIENIHFCKGNQEQVWKIKSDTPCEKEIFVDIDLKRKLKS